jgi:hypothetical protein
VLEHKLLPAAQLRQDWTALIPGAGVSTKQAERAVLQDIAETLAELDSDVRSDPELQPQLDAEELAPALSLRPARWLIIRSSTRRPGLISLSSRSLSNTRSTAAWPECATSCGWRTAAISSASTTHTRLLAPPR